MRFPVYFRRAVGGAFVTAAIPVLGTATDPVPTFATTAKKNAPNVLSHKLTRPAKRVAIGYWYEGAGAVVVLPVTLWVWDDESLHWYQSASGTLTNGQLTYLRIPSLADPPQVQANMGRPQHGIEAMIVIADNGGADGIFHFVAGPDSSEF